MFRLVLVRIRFVLVQGRGKGRGRGRRRRRRNYIWYRGAARQRTLLVIRCSLGRREVAPSVDRGRGDRTGIR